MAQDEKNTLEWIYKAIVTTLLAATLTGIAAIWNQQVRDAAFQSKLSTQVDFIIEHINAHDQSIKDISDRIQKLESRIQSIENGTSRRK